ncbi:MAG: hypothetical protein MJ007_02870 [Paludibacteraceae bacterium]|nr:hypothetical protein [Paludibacteraceae bacterium]
MTFGKKTLEALIRTTTAKLNYYKKYRAVTELNRDAVNFTLYTGRIETADAFIEDLENDLRDYFKQMEAYR